MIDLLAADRRAFVRTCIDQDGAISYYLGEPESRSEAVEELSEFELSYLHLSVVVNIFDEYIWRTAKGATTEMAIRRIEADSSERLGQPPSSGFRRLDKYISYRLRKNYSHRPISDRDIEQLLVRGEMWAQERKADRVVSRMRRTWNVPLNEITFSPAGGIYDYVDAEALNRDAYFTQDLLIAKAQASNCGASRRDLFLLKLVPRVREIAAAKIYGGYQWQLEKFSGPSR